MKWLLEKGPEFDFYIGDEKAQALIRSEAHKYNYKSEVMLGVLKNHSETGGRNSWNSFPKKVNLCISLTPSHEPLKL